MAKGVGDEGQSDAVPIVLGGMAVEVHVEWCSWRRVVLEKMQAESANGFGWTEVGVIVGRLAYLFAFYSILLVSKCE